MSPPTVPFPVLSLVPRAARPKPVIRTSKTGRKYTVVDGLGRFDLSRDSADNQAKIGAVATRFARAGSAARDAMEIHRFALAELEALRSSLDHGALHCEPDSILADSLDRTIALSQALLDEAATFVWEETAISNRLAKLRDRLG